MEKEGRKGGRARSTCRLQTANERGNGIEFRQFGARKTNKVSMQMANYSSSEDAVRMHIPGQDLVMTMLLSILKMGVALGRLRRSESSAPLPRYLYRSVLLRRRRRCSAPKEVDQTKFRRLADAKESSCGIHL